MVNVQAQLIEWFVNNADLEPAVVHQNIAQNYFEMQWIDSFQFISLVMSIEELYQISFNQDEFQNRNFSTIAGLTSIIEKKIDEQKKCTSLHV